MASPPLGRHEPLGYNVSPQPQRDIPFDRMDANGDGVIDRSEWREYLKTADDQPHNNRPQVAPSYVPPQSFSGTNYSPQIAPKMGVSPARLHEVPEK